MAKTALITGASSGIGLELARVCAQNGHNVVLVARSEDKLHALAIDLHKEHGIEAHVLAKDLSDYNSAAEVYSFCEQQGVQVDYLVNNAGFGDYGMFAQSNWDKQLQMINLNITTLTYLHAPLPARHDKP